MAKEINEVILKITGSASIPNEEYETGDDVGIILQGKVVKVELADTQSEGKNNKIIKVKIITAEIKKI